MEFMHHRGSNLCGGCGLGGLGFRGWLLRAAPYPVSYIMYQSAFRYKTLHGDDRLTDTTTTTPTLTLTLTLTHHHHHDTHQHHHPPEGGGLTRVADSK